MAFVKISSRNRWFKMTLRYCCAFVTLRQGTMLIGVVELSITFIALFIMLLAAMNTQEIASVVSDDIQSLENSLPTQIEDAMMQFYYGNNERRMLTGQYLATVTMTVFYTGTVLSIMHMLSCIMLLYGALYDLANYLLPWLSTVLLSIVTVTLLLISIVFFQHPRCMASFYIMLALALAIQVHNWLVVFNYYREITYKNIYRDIENIVQPYELKEDLKYAKIDI